MHRGVAPSTTRQRLARAVAQLAEHPALDRLGGWRGLERELRVDLTRGLDGANGADLTRRRTVFQPPPDEVEAKKKEKKQKKLEADAAWLHRPWWRLALRVLVKDPPTVVLWVAALGSLIQASASSAAGDTYAEAGFLLVMAALMASTRIATEWQKQSQLRELLADTEQLCEPKEETGSETEQLVEVLRCGEPTRIPREELCVGDLLLLRGGDVAVADGLVVPDPLPTQAAYGGVRVVMAGSTISACKSEGDVVLAGTRIVDGAAIMVVLALGDASKYDQENCRKLFEHSYKATARAEIDEVGSGYVQVPRTPRGNNTHPGGADAATRRPRQAQAREHGRLPEEAQSPFHAHALRTQKRLARTGLVTACMLFVVLNVLGLGAGD